ncbi:16S rRNA (cytosine(967)-C(5))-methyltransferase RsmB [Euzebya tangerina]|uniref:16S rRNA (cytosine(967)-C(5))-methyltransferase RsmB n=1 Tax=Euzebya tangerina TaxID=591198 RepID=UPI000E30BEC8|nr:16S rRNA (cytosine(967)-C(5))-methyltransferase RsmB [Euzebya tangerina]
MTQDDGVATRQAALAALLQIDDQQAWASPVVDRVLSGSGLDDRDRAYVANLVFSTLRWEGTLDWMLAHLVTRGLDAVQQELLHILRLGTWELRFGAAPAHAGVNTWVEVARHAVGDRATGFVNGVLRNVVRRGDTLPWPDPTSVEGVALATAHPPWVVELARERFGVDRATDVLAAGNETAPLILRAVAPREEVVARLAADGVAASAGSLTDTAVVLGERVPPGRLAVISEGLAIVQDQSSQVVGATAAREIPAGATAVDLCAAPGGKTTHLAQAGLAVTAVDRHAGRLRRTAELAARLGLSITTRLADGAASGLPEASADLVLVDAPCSGLGVVRRRPELRWRKDPADVTALRAVQERLLRAAVLLTKPGGRIVYSVCTWTVAETDQVVAAVVEDGTAVLERAGQTAPNPDASGSLTEYGRQLAPDTEQGDGMYLAVLRRPAEPGAVA